MPMRDVYDRGFDEDVPVASEESQCPDCDGRVTTNAVEPACEYCGLVIDGAQLDHWPEWDETTTESSPPAVTPARLSRPD